MYQQLWWYKVEDKLYLGVREQKMLNTTDLDDEMFFVSLHVCTVSVSVADQWDDSDDKCANSVKVMECLASYASRVCLPTSV
jgi:hypothetical protein